MGLWGCESNCPGCANCWQDVELPRKGQVMVTISETDAVSILDASFDREAEDFLAEGRPETHPFRALYRLDGAINGHDGDADKFGRG